MMLGRRRQISRGEMGLVTAIKTLIVLAVAAIVIVDGSAVLRVTTGLSTLAPQAGHAAVAAAVGKPITTVTAQSAYAAAEAVAKAHGGHVQRNDFRLTPDGWVTLTVTEDAHTLLLHFVPGLGAWTHRSKTLVVTP